MSLFEQSKRGPLRDREKELVEELKSHEVEDILDAIYLHRLNKKLDTLIAAVQELTRFVAPPLHRFPPSERYRFLNIAAGQTAIIYDLKIPKDSVGIITEVANTWFVNTFYVWAIDGGKIEQVQRQIAPVNAPLVYERGIPSFEEILWEAHNDDVVAHVFEVLCDGYYIDRKIYNKIVKT